MDKNFFHNHFIYKHRKGIALLLLIGFLGSPLGGVLPARAAETAATGDTQSKGLLQGLFLDPMKTFFSGLSSFNYGDFLKLIIKDSLNTVVDRFYSQVVKSFEDEYLVQDYNRQVFVPYLDFGFAKFHNWVASEVGDAKIDAPLLNAFLGLENLAYRGLKETGAKLSHSVLKELDKVSNEMSGEDRPPSISDHDYWGKSMARIWSTPQGLFWGAVGTTMDVAASSEAEGNRDYIISEGHNDGRKVTDMPEAIESYFLQRGGNLNKSELNSKLNVWGYTPISSPATSGAFSGYNLASKGTYYVYPLSNGFYRFDIWSWDADFPFAFFCDIQYKIDVIETLVKPNVWQDPQKVYPTSIAFTSRAISDPLASGWTGLIKRPGQKVKVMVNDLIESKLKIAGDATDLSGVSRIMYDLGKTYLTNVNFKVKRATSGALAGCPVGFEVIEPDLGTTMGKMGEPSRPSAGQCLIAALKQVDTNFLGEIVGWVSDLGKKLICWIFDLKDKKGEYLTKKENGIETQNYTMVPNKGSLEELKNNDAELKKALNKLTPADLEALNKAREEAAKTDPNGYTPLLVKNDKGEFQAQASSIDSPRKQSLISFSTLAQILVYEELIKPLLPSSVEGAAKKGLGIIGTGLKWLARTAGNYVGLGDTAEGWVNEIGSYLADSGAVNVMAESVNFIASRSAIRKVLELLNFCNLEPEENQIKTETINLSTDGRYDFLEFPYRLFEKSNVTVEIRIRPTDTAEENAKPYRTLVFNDMPAGVHIARWDLSTDLSDAESNQIWSEITESVYIYVFFKKEVNGALETFQSYTIPTVTRKQFLSGEKYKPDPTTAAKNCYNKTYFTIPGGANPAPCGRGYLAQNYMLELPQDPPPYQNMNVFDRQFAPTPIFYEGQEVSITMRYNNDNFEKPADDVNVTLYDLAGVEGGVENFFGLANFYTGDLTNEAGNQIANKNAKKVYEKTIEMPINCSPKPVDQPGCKIATVDWTAVEPGAHALMMVFDSDEGAVNKDQNKLNNRIIQIVNVSASPVTAEYKISDGLKTADLRGDGDHPDGDGTGVANPGEDIEIGVTLKDIRPLHSGSLSGLDLFIDLENSPVFQYIGSGKNDSGDNKSSIKIGMIVSGQTLILNKDFNLRVKDDAKSDGDAKVPLYLRDQYGRVVFHQDLTVPVFTRCSDGVDNDKDGDIDEKDADCSRSSDNKEDGNNNIMRRPDLIPIGMTYTVVPQCSDKEDNDGDGKTDYPADPNCASKDDITESGARGIFKDAELTLNFQVKNQGERGIWPSSDPAKPKTMPVSIYVCYGKPATQAEYRQGWRFNKGYYCEQDGNSKYITEKKEVQLPVDECYCEPKPPASSSVLGSVPEFFALPDSGFPTADEITNSYQDYISCIEKKYKQVTSLNYPINESWDPQGVRTISTPFKVLEDRDMRFAIFVDGKVDSSSHETEGNIPEYIEKNNKAGFPDYFCKDSEGGAYLTLDPARNKNQCYYFDSDKEPPKYLSPICMENFRKTEDYHVRIGEKSWTPPVNVGVAPSPFQYQYTCPSFDTCKKAGCVASTADDWRANPGEYVLLTVNLENTASRDVKSTFTLTDGPGTKTGINLTTPELVSYAKESKQLFFYVTIPICPIDDKDCLHPYNNNDTLTFTLKGKEGEKSPNKPGTEFIIAANLPVKLGTLPAQCPDKPKEVPPQSITNIAIQYQKWIKQGASYASVDSQSGARILHGYFQIINEGTEDVNNLSYSYTVYYFDKEPTGQTDSQGCYGGGAEAYYWSAPSYNLAEGSPPLEKEDDYPINLGMKKWGFFQFEVHVTEIKSNGTPGVWNDDNNNDHRKCSGLAEVKEPDLVVESVQASKNQRGENYCIDGSVELVNAGSEELDLANTVDTADAYVTILDKDGGVLPGQELHIIDFIKQIKGKLLPGAATTINFNGYCFGPTIPEYYKKAKVSVSLIDTDDHYDQDKSNNWAESVPIELSKTLGASTQRFLTLGQRIKRVLNYVRVKLGD